MTAEDQRQRTNQRERRAGVQQRQWVVSASASRRLQFAARWLQQADQAVVVAPTRGAADDLARGLAHTAGGMLGLHRTTLAQLAAELAVGPMAGFGLSAATSLAAEALAARATAAAVASGAVSYFGPVLRYPGFPRALVHTLSELRRQQVDVDRLDEAGNVGADLRVLAAEYRACLRRWSLADPEMVLELAADTLTGGDHRYARCAVLLLDLTPCSRLEEQFLAALVRAAPGAAATVLKGDGDATQRLARVFGRGPQDLDQEPAAASRLERLRRAIFSEAPAGPVPEDESVQWLSAPGEGRECIEIARRVHRLAAEGVRFDRMAVLLRDADAYVGLLEEAFSRAEVPMYATRGTVRPDPAGRALLALLACAADDFSATRFAEYLSLGQVPVPDEHGAPRAPEIPWVEPVDEQLVFKSAEPVVQIEEGRVAGAATPIPPELEDAEAPVLSGALRTPRRWEQLLVDAAVLGGHGRWQRRLRGLRAELLLQLRQLEEEDARRALVREQVSSLEHLERFALPVIERLARLRRCRTWGEWLAQLRELAVATLRQPDRVLRVLAELEPMDEVGPVGLEEVRRALEQRLSLLRQEPTGHRYGKVFVGTLDEARGRTFDTVFLPGLAEGLFPRRAFEDPLLLDAHRRTIAPGLARRPQRVERERLLLRVAIGAAERRLVISYPTLEPLQGRARVPSFYALDVMRATEGQLPDLEHLRQRAIASSKARLGWPAPAVPTDAIDEAEFDIAYLAPYLTGARRDGRGRARFLLHTNPYLERSLRTRWQRWNRKFWPADGIVRPDEATLAVLREHRLTARSYSPTALQHFAICPYRFLLHAVQRLRPRQDPVPLERMDPLTRGSLFHEVQYRLLVALRERQWLPITPDRRERVLRLADTVLGNVAQEYREELAPAVPRVWDNEIQDLATDIRGWIREVSEHDTAWVPKYFEFSFGLGQGPGRDPLSHREEAVLEDGTRLRGCIDLLEYDPARDVWRVTDHKTGRAPRERLLVLHGGEVLQPLLYGLAAEHHLHGRVESGRLYYCTRRGDYETRDVQLSAENRSKLRQALAIIDRALDRGFLPAAPKQGACERCDFAIVCGPYETVRLRRKEPAELAELESLRGLP